jgi:hypothetical protein
MTNATKTGHQSEAMQARKEGTLLFPSTRHSLTTEDTGNTED